MSIRGQTPEAWCSRWRQGECPVHGTGLVVDAESAPAEDGVSVHCANEECDVRACRWPGKDDQHSFFGWLAGPAEIHAVLVKGGDVAAEGPRPGNHARSVRTGWRLEEEPHDRNRGSR